MHAAAVHVVHVWLTCCRFGNTCLMHLEDMSFENLGRLFARYRGTFPCFSDDVQVRTVDLFLLTPLSVVFKTLYTAMK